MQYNTIQYNTIQYNTIQYNTIHYNTLQYNMSGNSRTGYPFLVFPLQNRVIILRRRWHMSSPSPRDLIVYIIIFRFLFVSGRCTLIKSSKIFFSTLKDVIFIASYLGTHQLILGGLWNLYGAEILFQKFLNKPMQRERDFGGLKYFFENFIPPSPLPP